MSKEVVTKAQMVKRLNKRIDVCREKLQTAERILAEERAKVGKGTIVETTVAGSIGIDCETTEDDRAGSIAYWEPIAARWRRAKVEYEAILGVVMKS